MKKETHQILTPEAIIDEWENSPYYQFMSRVEWPPGIICPPSMPPRVFRAKLEADSNHLWREIYGGSDGRR